jgi:hypothetical protein
MSRNRHERNAGDRNPERKRAALEPGWRLTPWSVIRASPG